VHEPRQKDAVARKIIASRDRERRQPGGLPAGKGSRDQTNCRLRRVRVFEVVSDFQMIGVKTPRGRIVVVAFLGDGQSYYGCLAVGKPVEQRRRVSGPSRTFRRQPTMRAFRPFGPFSTVVYKQSCGVRRSR
jgi:hypothetical protein